MDSKALAEQQLEMLQSCGLAGSVVDPDENGMTKNELDQVLNSSDKCFSATLADGRVVILNMSDLPAVVQSVRAQRDVPEVLVQKDAPKFHSTRQADQVDGRDAQPSTQEFGGVILSKLSAIERELGLHVATTSLITEESRQNTHIVRKLDQILSCLDTLTGACSEVEPDRNNVDGAAATLDGVLQPIECRLNDFRVTADLAPLHQAHARQATAMSQALARFEAVAEKFVSNAKTESAGILDMKTALDGLEIKLDSLGEDDGLKDVAESVRVIRGDLNTLMERTQTISAAPPDNVVMRQSLARFSTSLDMAIRRIEAVAVDAAGRHALDGGDDPILVDLVDAVVRGVTQANKSTWHEDSSSAALREQVSDFIEDLRFATAELLAACARNEAIAV